MKPLSSIIIILLISSVAASGQSGLTGTPTTLALGGTVTGPTTLDFATSTTANLLVKKETANYFTILNGGNIGIGTTTPTYKLDVIGGARFTGAFVVGNDLMTATKLQISNGRLFELQGSATTLNIFDASAGYSRMNINANGNIGIGTTVDAGYKLDVTGTGRFTGAFVVDNDIMTRTKLQISNGRLFEFQGTPTSLNIFDASAGYSRMNINANGNISIGTTVDAGYKLNVVGDIYSSTKILIGTIGLNTGTYSLAVNGSALFTKAVVKQSTSWPDYVFEPDYKLPALKDVETFLINNKHLPDMPTATEVEKNGIDLGDTQTILLKKVEELTLYMIDQNKKMERQGEEINDLKKQLNLLQKTK